MTLSDAEFADLGQSIARQMGLHFPLERRNELERSIRLASAKLGFDDAEACARWILRTPLTGGQIEILAGYLTVGETYFFREKPAFDALREFLPALIEARRGKHEMLRLWSAGCCTGEEPYSIAIWLRETFPELSRWNVSILATDINRAFVQKAIDGVYRQWSFRETPPELQERYFTRAGKDAFEVLPDIKRSVTFSSLNLVEDSYPSVLNGINAMDVIFCRNVLMYFTPAQAARVIGRFYLSLVEGGWLMVSPVEASQTLFSQFTTLNFPGTICYRKDALAQTDAMSPGSAPARSAAAPVSTSKRRPASRQEVKDAPPNAPQPTLFQQAAALHESGLYVEAVETLTAWLSAHSGDAAAMALLASACANQGRLDEARQWCEQAIAADKMNAGHHYLLATILQEIGAPVEVEAALKRALYLAPEFVMAHFALATLAREQGNDRTARKYFANVRSLLSACLPDDAVPESGGMTAGRLLDIARLLI